MTSVPLPTHLTRRAGCRPQGNQTGQTPDWARVPDRSATSGRSPIEETRILVIEPDETTAMIASRCLEEVGYTVGTVGDGLIGQERSLREPVDLVILARTPGCDGLDVLGAIHDSKPQLPVIVLAARPQSNDCVACLGGGAVDYIAEPFSPNELAARVHAHLRKSRWSDPTRLRVGDVELDRLSRRVSRGKGTVQLTAREAELLACLMRNAGLVLSRSQLLRAVWGYHFDPGTNIVEVYMGYLRRKLGSPAPIKTVRGKGYQLVWCGQSDISDES